MFLASAQPSWLRRFSASSVLGRNPRSKPVSRLAGSLLMSHRRPGDTPLRRPAVALHGEVRNSEEVESATAYVQRRTMTSSVNPGRRRTDTSSTPLPRPEYRAIAEEAYRLFVEDGRDFERALFYWVRAEERLTLRGDAADSQAQ
jgi:hypothetical protein